MKNIPLFLLGLVTCTMVYAASWESSNTDATPIVGYGYYNNGTANVLTAIAVNADGTIYLH